MNQKGNPNIPPGPGRPKGSQNRITKAAKELAEEILDDEYIVGLARRIKAGKAPHMETLLWGHAKGKPKGEDDGNPQQTLINVLAVLGDLPTETLKQLKEAFAQKTLPPGE